MLKINGNPIAPVAISLAPQWHPNADRTAWEMPMSATIGFQSLQWATQTVTLPGVPDVILQGGARTPLALDALPSLEAQLYSIIAALYESEESKAQLKPDGWVPPVPPEPPIEEVTE